jgi:ubiquinol-cytochrome c reductase cytochrome b subunit
MNIFSRVLDAFEKRTGLFKLMGQLARHPVPPDTGWYYVFGSAVLTCLIIQVVTGMALATQYIAATNDAYQAVDFITTRTVLGNLLRGMHFFGASAMIALIGIHMIQVFLMGCYKYPREFNWVTGVCLLFLVVAMGFTGQLLRWDSTSVWATVLSAEMIGRTPFIGKVLARFLLGGKTLGGATLSRFFAYHVFYLPAIIFLFVGIHIYLVFHDGISAPPIPGERVNPETYDAEYEKLIKEKGVPFWPDAAWRDVVFALLVVASIVALAAIFGPPAIKAPPSPTALASAPAPDWYLLWYFAVLALLPRGIESAFMILAPLSVIIFLLLMPAFWNSGERHPRDRPWAIALVIMVVTTLTAFTIEAVIAPWSPRFDAKPLPISVIGASSGPVFEGGRLFHDKACEDCHTIAGHGGLRGPNLTTIGDRLTADQLKVRILDGGGNMPAFAGILQSGELDDLIAFLQSRRGPSGVSLRSIYTSGQ